MLVGTAAASASCANTRSNAEALICASFGRPRNTLGGSRRRRGSLNAIEVMRGGAHRAFSAAPHFHSREATGCGSLQAVVAAGAIRLARSRGSRARRPRRAVDAVRRPFDLQRRISRRRQIDDAATPCFRSPEGSMIKFAIDAGGTFTDLFGFDDKTGNIIVEKALTTPRDLSEGVVESICHDRNDRDRHESGLVFVHGGTTAINAITERKGVRTALVTTAGFRDYWLSGAATGRISTIFFRTPEPFVPRHLRFEVASGSTPRAVCDRPFVADWPADRGGPRRRRPGDRRPISAHLHQSGTRGRLPRRVCGSICPGSPITARHEVSREWREYERANTAVLSAYVQPIMARYLDSLGGALESSKVLIVRVLACSRTAGALGLKSAERTAFRSS